MISVQAAMWVTVDENTPLCRQRGRFPGQKALCEPFSTKVSDKTLSSACICPIFRFNILKARKAFSYAAADVPYKPSWKQPWMPTTQWQECTGKWSVLWWAWISLLYAIVCRRMDDIQQSQASPLHAHAFTSFDSWMLSQRAHITFQYVPCQTQRFNDILNIGYCLVRAKYMKVKTYRFFPFHLLFKIVF